MRIGINGTFWDRPTTGSGQYIRSLLPALVQCAPENEYVVLVPGRTDIDSQELVPSRIQLRPEPVALDRWSENLAKVWFEQVTFRRACQREHVTLAHIPYFASPYLPATCTVVTIHDLIPLVLPLYRGSALVRLYTRLVATSARHAHAIIADSEPSKRDIVQHLKIPADRIHVVHLAADSRFRPISDVAQIEAVREKYGLPDKMLLYLGGMDQRKNLRVIVEAFALLPELYRAGFRLVFAGVALGEDSEFFPNPQRIGHEVGLAQDAIQFTGWAAEEDKPALYASATVFLFPSIYEGFGLPPLEAMACGTPVIVANASSLPEIVGSAGIQVDPYDTPAWADAIRQLVDDPARRQEMSVRGLAQASKFSWARTAKETLAVYNLAMR